MPYPFKNPVSPTYQEVMRSNIGVPSEDLIDFDKTDKAVNASARLSEIDAEIARLKQRIAEKRASDRLYNKPASKFDYIISGDRSGLDRIAQQKMTEAIADKQRINTALDKMDELMKLRNKAVINVNYAEQVLKDAENKGDQTAIEAAKRDLQLAKEDLAYYNNRTGYNETPTKESSPEPKQSSEVQDTPVNLKVDLERYKAFKKGNKAELYDILKEIEDNPNFNQSPELRAEYQRIKSIKSDEQLAAEKAARKAKWEEGKKLKGSALFEWAGKPENKALLKEFGPIGEYGR